MATGRLHNRIDLIWSGDHYEETRSNAICYPGTLGLLNSAGLIGPHGTAGTIYAIMIIMHQQKLGKIITDTWASGTLVSWVTPQPGDVFNMLLESVEDVGLDDFLTVTTSGSLKVATSTDRRLFQPLEVLTGTGSGDRFCKCRFIG